MQVNSLNDDDSRLLKINHGNSCNFLSDCIYPAIDTLTISFLADSLRVAPLDERDKSTWTAEAMIQSVVDLRFKQEQQQHNQQNHQSMTHTLARTASRGLGSQANARSDNSQTGWSSNDILSSSPIYPQALQVGPESEVPHRFAHVLMPSLNTTERKQITQLQQAFDYFVSRLQRARFLESKSKALPSEIDKQHDSITHRPQSPITSLSGAPSSGPSMLSPSESLSQPSRDHLVKVQQGVADLEERGKGGRGTELDKMLAIVREEQVVHDLFFQEIIRQVSVQCVQRGNLLASLRQYYAALFARVPRHAAALQVHHLLYPSIPSLLSKSTPTLQVFLKSHIYSLYPES